MTSLTFSGSFNSLSSTVQGRASYQYSWHLPRISPLSFLTHVSKPWSRVTLSPCFLHAKQKRTTSQSLTFPSPASLAQMSPAPPTSEMQMSPAPPAFEMSPPLSLYLMISLPTSQRNGGHQNRTESSLHTTPTHPSTDGMGPSSQPPWVLQPLLSHLFRTTLHCAASLQSLSSPPT